MTVEERIGLVFTWDPRPQHWVKERGPDDAPPPPADPIDNGAVQTYFLDPQTGRWNGTILGLKGRQISVELADKYRTPKMVGLAIIAKIAPKTSAIPTPDQKKSAVPMMAGIAAVVVVIAAGAFAAQAVMKQPSSASASNPAATSSAVVSAPVVEPTVAASAEATPAPTAAPTQAPPVRTNPPTVAPTVAPPAPQVVTYTHRLPNGSVVAYRGPNSVVQGTNLNAAVSYNLAAGVAGTEPVTINVGPLGSAQGVTVIPDRTGNSSFSLRVTLAKGTYPISFSLGRNGEIRILGNITVR